MATKLDTMPAKKKKRLDRTHYLYIFVIVGVGAGILVGLVFPTFAVDLKPLGDAFVSLIKMMIAPIIFCTITLGVGSIAKAATVGKVGGLAIGYFMIMSTIALTVGLLVGNLIHPGEGLNITNATYSGKEVEAQTTQEFLLGIIPTSLLSAFVDDNILQVLLVALLSGFALQKMGSRGAPILGGIRQIQVLVFRILAMIMWVAPIGAFGAIAAVVGNTGVNALLSLGMLMVAFYITCLVYVIFIIGLLLKFVTGVSIFSLMKYLAREYLLIVSTSSSEVALPRLIAKLEHLGVSKPVVGITVPTGYSFNLDGTAIYLTMSALFISSALGKPLDLPEQISLLAFMIIASKGAAGVTGAGLATLAGGLQTNRPDLVDGVGVIVGIDRFMSEARALTNFTGNSVASLLIGRWTGELDLKQVKEVLSGRDPFNEASMSVDEPMGHDEAVYVKSEEVAEKEQLARAVADVQQEK